MLILIWIGVGLITGWYSGMLIGNGYGLISYALLGVVGGLTGGYLASTLFSVPDAVNALNLFSIAVAFLGAVMVIGITRVIAPHRA